MEEPEISVVMGVYNGGDPLEATLQSILAQDDAALELVVVDDGSTDSTPALLAGYAGRDRRIRVLTQPNQGLTRALIAGCAAARGALIARHDAGDLSHPKRLARQRGLFSTQPHLAFVSCATEYVGPEGEHLYAARSTGRAATAIPPFDANTRQVVIAGPTHHGAVMFRRDAYERAGGYRAMFRFGQDWDLWYRLGSDGLFQSIDEVLYTARITPDSISSTARRAQEKFASLARAAFLARSRGEKEGPILEEASLIALGPRKGRCARAGGLYFIGEALRRNRDRRGARYLREAALLCPLHVRAWLRWAQSMVSFSAPG